MIKKIISSFVATLFLVPLFLGAEGAITPPPTIGNPVGPDNLYEFLTEILDIVLFIGVPVIIFFIIYAGFLFVTARGNETQLETAKKTLLWALIGGAVLLGGKVIAFAIEGTINNLRS